jgi:hypothetical protein
MSYLENMKEQVQQSKEEEVESFKSFIEDFCVKQFRDSIPTPVATTDKNELLGQDISVSNFVSWLEAEGFSVTINEYHTGTLVISYE